MLETSVMCSILHNNMWVFCLQIANFPLETSTSSEAVSVALDCVPRVSGVMQTKASSAFGLPENIHIQPVRLKPYTFLCMLVVCVCLWCFWQYSRRNKHHLKISLEVIKCGTRANNIVCRLQQRVLHNLHVSIATSRSVHILLHPRYSQTNGNENMWSSR